MINTNRIVRAVDLAKKFDVSTETIRRDLEQLEKEHLIRRVHGGAVPNIAGGAEPDYSYREIENYAEKVRIGRRAAELVEDGDSIIIDIGTTLLEFSRFLRGKKIRVFTNSLKVALELMEDEHIEVIMLGGVVRPGEGTTSGHWAENAVDEIFADKLFLGTAAVDPNRGIMDYHLAETNLRRHYIKNSKQRIVLADFSKFGRKVLSLTCGFSEIDRIITDDRTDHRILQAIRGKGVLTETVRVYD